jgi:serine/threonine-protein kinase
MSIEKDTRLEIRLDDYVQRVEITVEPWGEVYLDGEHVGTAPMAKPIFVLPGLHILRLTHPSLPSIEKQWQATAGETLKLRANLQTSELAVGNGVAPK